MLVSYLLGLLSGCLSCVCFGFTFVLSEYGLENGFNIFEILFFRGIISLLIAFVFDIFHAFYNVCRSYQTANGNGNGNGNGLGNRSASLSHSETDPLISRSGDYNHRSRSDSGYQIEMFKMFNLNDGSKKWLFLVGLGKSLSIILFYYSISLLDMNIGLTLYFTISVWSLLFDECFFVDSRLKILPIHFFATVFVIIGVILLAQPSFIFDNDYINQSLKGNGSSNGKPQSMKTFELIIGYVCGILSAILETISLISMKKYSLSLSHPSYQSYHGHYQSLSIVMQGMYCVSMQFLLFGIIGSLIFYQEFLFNWVTNININGEMFDINIFLYLFGIGMVSYLSIHGINDSVTRLSMIEVSLLISFELIFIYLFYQNGNDYWIAMVGIIMIVLPVLLLLSNTIYCIIMKRNNNNNNSNNNNNNNNNNGGLFYSLGFGAIGIGIGDTSLSINESIVSSHGMEPRTSICFSHEYPSEE